MLIRKAWRVMRGLHPFLGHGVGACLGRLSTPCRNLDVRGASTAGLVGVSLPGEGGKQRFEAGIACRRPWARLACAWVGLERCSALRLGARFAIVL